MNVQALETVQPKDLEASEIAVRLGATWLNPELIKQFADELVDAPYYVRDRVKVAVHSADRRLECDQQKLYRRQH